MKRVLLILFVSSGLIFSCNSNKGGKGTFGKKGKHRSHKSVSASAKGAPGNSASLKASADSTSSKSTLEITEGFDPNSRPGLIYNGASGPGTGGTYASAAYRQSRMPRKNRKELYKYRAYLHNDGLYPNMGNKNTVPGDSSLVQSDSTMLDWSDSMTVESDSTDYSYWEEGGEQ